MITKKNEDLYKKIITSLMDISDKQEREFKIFEFRRQFGHILNDWQLNGKERNLNLTLFFNQWLAAAE